MLNTDADTRKHTQQSWSWTMIVHMLWWLWTMIMNYDYELWSCMHCDDYELWLWTMIMMIMNYDDAQIMQQ